MDKTRDIDFLLFDNLNLLDVAGPAQAFRSANVDGRTRYRLRFLSMDGGAIKSCCDLQLGADAPMEQACGLDLLIPGGRGIDTAMARTEILERVKNWRKPGRDRRVISICSGALILAKAGLLDGRRATTHWGRTAQVHEQFPQVNWNTNDLYSIDGDIFTSAGVTSGIDLALEIIRRDHGPSIALSVARELVVYLKRSGGQNQFTEILEAQFTGDRELTRLIDLVQDDLSRDWTLDGMADAAGLTARTLTRRFSALTGLSPVKFLERARVKRASHALSSGVPVGKCIELSGFHDFQQMQRAFKRHLGTTIGRYVETFVN